MTNSERFELLFTPKVEKSFFRFTQKILYDHHEDLFQGTLAMAIQKMDLFKGGNFCAWLKRIAFRQRCTFYRKLKIQQKRESRMRSFSEMGFRTPESDMEVLESVEEMMKPLNEKEREIVKVVYIDDYKYREAATICGVKMGTVMSRLARCRKKMQDELTS